jgi:hypothetical protein
MESRSVTYGQTDRQTDRQSADNSVFFLLKYAKKYFKQNSLTIFPTSFRFESSTNFETFMKYQVVLYGKELSKNSLNFVSVDEKKLSSQERLAVSV